MSRYKTSLLTFLFFTSLVFSQEAEHYETALNSYNQGDINSTYIHLRNALDESPSHLPSKLLMGRVLVIKGRFNEAITELNEAKEFGADKNLVNPVLAEAYLYAKQFEKILPLTLNGFDRTNEFELTLIKGSAYSNLKKLDKASEQYVYALSLFPNNSRALNSLSALYLQTGQLAKAKTLITKSIGINKKNARTIHLQGQLAKLESRPLEALTFFEAAHALSPTNPIIKRSLATAYSQMDDERAIDIVNDILAQTPDDPLALLLLGRLHSKDNENELAISVYEDLTQRLTALPDDLSVEQNELYFVAGLASYLTGNYESALTKFEQYNSVKHSNTNALALTADTLVKLNQAKEAQILLENNLNLVRENENLSLALCNLFLDNEKTFKCISLLDSIKRDGVDSVNVTVMRVRILQKNEKYADALALFTQHFPDPDADPYRFMFINLLIENKKIEQALKLTQAVLNQEPDNSSYQLLLTQLLYQKKQFKESLALAETFNALFPKNRAGLIVLVKSHLALANYASAEHLAKGVVNEHPEDTRAAFLLAQSLFFQNKLEQAQDILLRIKTVDSNNPLPLELLARLYVKQNNLLFARKELEQLIRKHLFVPEYHIALANVFYKERNIEDAIKQLNIVQGIWADQPHNLIELSQHQNQIQDYSGAYTSLKRAEKLSPDNSAVIMPLIRSALRVDKLDEAYNYAISFAKKHPDNVGANIRLGEVLNAQKKSSQAQSYFLKALELDNRNKTAAAQLYQIALKGEKDSKFENIANTILQKNPSAFFVRRLLADYLLQAGENNQALEHYLTLANSNEIIEKANINNNIAFIYSQSKPELALGYASKAVEESHNNADYIDTKGWVLAKLKRLDEALPYLRQAYAINSASPSIRYHLAYTLFYLDRKEEAKQELTEILNLEATFPERQDAEALFNQI
ncbi:PEP-CTERM system TPR-repeat protein PrsT [Alteromonas sp. 5E99-2]|uniref:XrtA/PEP-CTERM system TPR-repeat protein PrsT n=1 Tax=Alteromonas sp. 5E99-2 TaxID=2817683 RepID=UPI001A987E85|nr:XrtA/PEP-CTERM system TPR-repeat protein PrsT [Alteromonas sp. 5E99-2]MBO1254061.1 PEP-CTERM system TPR-repeat protein PrsT [Alteromonas sp. 5E99-2]